MLQKPWLCGNTAPRCRQILNVSKPVKVYENYQCKATILYIYQSQWFVSIYLHVLSPGPDLRCLGLVRGSAVGLDPLTGKHGAEYAGLHSFQTVLKKRHIKRKFDFARISSFLQKPHNINLSFLFFVVCNTWSFHHNLNQNNQFTSFCDYILYFTFYIFPFCLEINTHTDHFLISWEAMNKD